MSIDPNDPRPKQRQIADDLRSLVADRVIKPGERVPSTRELLNRYGVSSQTVQSALNILQDAGITQGVPGRGTFVRSELDVDALSHDDGPTDPSPEYQAFRREIQALGAEIRSIHQRLDDLQAQVDDVVRPPST